MTRMFGRLTVFGVAGISLIVGVLGVFLFVSRGKSLENATRLGLVLGRPVLQVRSPLAGDLYAPGGVSVLVAYADSERVASSTLRCLLNGRDVTGQLTLGRNGAAGRIFPLREGANSLRIEVYAQGLWTARYFEDSVELEFRVRPTPHLDQG